MNFQDQDLQEKALVFTGIQHQPYKDTRLKSIIFTPSKDMAKATRLK